MNPVLRDFIECIWDRAWKSVIYLFFFNKKIPVHFDIAGQNQGFKATGFQEKLQHYST